jgi:hypothetical protein
MTDGPAETDQFREQWLAWPAELFLADRHPDRPPVSIELQAGERPLVIETAEGAVHVRRGPAERPDAILTGSPHPILGLLSGHLDIDDARRRGVRMEGDLGALERVLPQAPAVIPAAAPLAAPAPAAAARGGSL